MAEEDAKKKESQSEDEKESDLAQLQERVSQVTPLVKPLGANILELIKSIPFIGASAAGGISFWLQQKLVISLLYFAIVFFLFYFLLPFYNSAGRRLRHHSDQWGSSFVDVLIARFKREAREIYWRYARKNQKFLLVQGENCQYDDMESFGRDRFTPRLKDIFVPLQLSSDNQDNLQRRGLVSKSIHLQEHQDLQIWHLLRLAKQDKQDHTFRRILIKADGGKGKTTFLRYITYSYFDQQLRRGLPKLLPVFIRLREWDHRLIPQSLASNPEKAQAPIADLAEFLQTYIKEDSRLKRYNFPDNWAKNALEQGQLLILWDGFDEIEKDWQNAVSDWLGQQMYNYPESYFILTSRPHWYDQSYTAKEKPRTVLYIEKFNLDQIQKFVHNWYACCLNGINKSDNYPNTQDFVDSNIEEYTDNLLKQIEEYPDLKELAKIPLNLNMIVNLHSYNPKEKLPQRRADLYQEILELQLIKRPKYRKQTMILHEQDRQKVLQNLALFMGNNEDKTKQIEIDKKSLDNHVIEFIQFLKYPDSIDGEVFIEKVVTISEILFQKDQFYEFAHLSFQSYLMAKEITDQGLEDLLFEKIIEKTDWWRDAAKFYAALQRNPNPFLRRLIAFNDSDLTALANECKQAISPEFLDLEFRVEFSQVSQVVNVSLYQQLETFLKKGQWQEADKETDRLMLQIVGKEADQWLNEEDIQNFDCGHLRAIDKLWVDYSKGKFGFSVQKKVWMDCGGVPGEYDYDVYKKFADQVGWRRSGDWLSYDELTFFLEGSEKAHLPVVGCGWLMFGGDSLFSRNDL
jgi:predicted NACHT family NTPase